MTFGTLVIIDYVHVFLFFLFFQASAFIVTYPVNNEVDRTGNENGKAVAWEKAFIRLVKVKFFTLFHFF